jgi:serralysin
MKLALQRHRRSSIFAAAIAAAAAAVLLSVPTALASSMQGGGSPMQLFVTGQPGEVNQITVTVAGGETRITDSAGITALPGFCNQDSPNQVTCAGPLDLVEVGAGDMDDRVELTVPQGAARAAIADGDAGNDVVDGSRSGLGLELTGSAGDDTVTGGPGDDLLNGEGRPGVGEPFTPETLAANSGDPGNDHVAGGNGNDGINAKQGADVVDAGEGNDFIETLASDPLSRGAPQDDGAVDVISCGGNTPGNGLGPGPPSRTDGAQVGQGDQVGADCEQVDQVAVCPAGATCVGTVTVTAPAGAGAASALASAAATKGGRQTTLGKSRKLRLHPGSNTIISITLRRKRVNAALGKRSQVAATMRFGLDRVRKGNRVGRVKKKVRFKLKR